MAKKLFVGNLPDGCTNEDLKGLFETVGEVEECDVLKNYGFVHMSTIEEALEAVNRLTGHRLFGNAIRVQHSTSDTRKGPGGMRGGGERGGGRGRGVRGRGASIRGSGGAYRGSRGGGRDIRERGGYADYKEERRERDYYADLPPRRLHPDPYYDRYYDDYYSRRSSAYGYPPYPRDYPYPPYRARSRSPPTMRRPLTPPRYRRRPESPPPREYYDYPPSDRYSEARSRPAAQTNLQPGDQSTLEDLLLAYPVFASSLTDHRTLDSPLSPGGHQVPSKASHRSQFNHVPLRAEI